EEHDMKASTVVTLLFAVGIGAMTSDSAAQSRESQTIDCLRQCEVDARTCVRDARSVAKSYDQNEQNLENQRRMIEQGLNQQRMQRGQAPQTFNPPRLFNTQSGDDYLAQKTQECKDNQKDCAASCR